MIYCPYNTNILGPRLSLLRQFGRPTLRPFIAAQPAWDANICDREAFDVRDYGGLLTSGKEGKGYNIFLGRGNTICPPRHQTTKLACVFGITGSVKHVVTLIYLYSSRI